MQQMRDVQAAARAAALIASGIVPNGLAPGGLVVAPGATPGKTDGGAGLWQGARLPTQTTSDGRTQVEIVQTEAKAILTWEKFNVGRETDLRFNQTAGGKDTPNWIAFNRVLDKSAEPSRILGTIKADGQVYVVSRNGVVFDGSSQVNVHTLVASSLSLSNTQFMAGINKGLKISSIYNDGADYGIPNFGDAPTSTELTIIPPVYSKPPGDVIVRSGALIESATGGKAMLFAPHVRNAGTIRTPSGQTILAAGENVWLANPVHTDPASTVRGLDVAVSSPTAFLLQFYNISEEVQGGRRPNPMVRAVITEMDARAAQVGYSATNTGVVEATRGNITMMARDVAQNGTLFASTALNNQDGSIMLRAWGQGMLGYGGDPNMKMFWWSAGTMSAGKGSVTAVLPDLTDVSDIERTNIATRYRAGSVDLRGNVIEVQSGATVVVPSGTITAVAGKLPSLLSAPANGEKVVDGSRIYVGEDALLSVAGLRDVLLSMESNSVRAELRINELRDSVLYVRSWLRGSTVYVDKRVSGSFADGPMAGVQWLRNDDGTYQTGKWLGTPLGDVTNWIGTGTTNLAELSTTAGKINLKSGGDIILRDGAKLDIAGGSVRFADGFITTTRLLGADGRFYDIGEATPDRQYVGFGGSFSRYHARIRVTETWNTMFDRNISRRFERGYTEGRNAGGIVVYSGSGFAMEGEIDGHVIAGEKQAAGAKAAIAGSLQIGNGGDPDRNWLSSSIIVTDKAVKLGSEFTVDSELPSSFFDAKMKPGEAYRAKTTYLDAGMLGRSGIGKFDLYYNNRFEVSEGTRLELAPGATLNVLANINPSEENRTHVALDGAVRIAGGTLRVISNNSIEVGAKGVLDVSGVWYNELIDGAPREAPRINGGSIALQASDVTAQTSVIGSLKLAETAVLDVSGGGWLSAAGAKQKLKVGDAGEMTLLSLVTKDISALDLRGYAAGSGGRIGFSMNGDIQIGGDARRDATISYLPPTLLADRGFRAVSVAATGSLIVADGTKIKQTPVGVDMRDVDYRSVASGAAITDLGRIRVLDLAERLERQPASLAFSGRKSVTIGAGASLTTDVRGSIALEGAARNGSSSIIVNGAITAPGGKISLKADSILLAAASQLNAAGVAAIVADPVRGQRTGSVLDGGTIELKASTLTIKPEALIDVSGASGEIDVKIGREPSTVVKLVSNGGLIAIEMSNSGSTSSNDVATNTIFGTFRAHRGGAGSTGGTLSIRVPAPSSGPTFNLPAMLYYIDRADGRIKSINSRGNIDIYREYSSGTSSAYRYSTVRGDIAAALDEMIPDARFLIVDPENDTTPGGASLPLSAFMPGGLNQLALLTKYFYTDRAATQRIVLPETKNAVTKLSSDTVNNGGFGSLNVDSNKFSIAPGIDLSLGRSITINAPITSLGTGTVNLMAPYVLLNALASGTSGPAGIGKIAVVADLIDITNAALTGFAETRLVARDLRMGALLGNLAQNRVSTLNVDGRLELKAGQIYPATGVLASIRAGTQLLIEGNGSAELPLSAAGSLTLQAPDIVQNGVVRAPFGSITFKADNRITLGAGSITSVSGDGLMVPYGALSNGEMWTNPLARPKDNGTSPTLDKLPEKTIVLDAPSIAMGAGSAIDIRGGGDLHASEFVVGSGGSHNVLTRPGTYAIMPDRSSVTAPGTGTAGARVWLAGGPGLAAGWYNLLPAEYALLPGAMAIQVVAGSSGNPMRNAMTLPDGILLMSGRFGNGLDGAVDQLASNFRVMSGEVIRKYSEFNEATANAFFSSEGFRLSQYRLRGLDIVIPQRPMDGGSVVFKAVNELALDGQLRSAAAPGGRAGLVDIAATNIAVVGAGQDRSDLTGYLVIDSARLSSFGAASLLLGGIRTSTLSGLSVQVVAGNILVRNDASSALVGPELILAASDKVAIGAGSVLRAEGLATGGSGNLVMTPQIAGSPADNNTPNDPSDDHPAIPARDFGALIRLSNGDVVAVNRTNVDNTRGHVDIAAGAVLAGGKALMIDATSGAALASSAAIAAADITLSGSAIGFGGGSSGLVFDAASLARFNTAENLTLRSYSTIDFHTGINFGSAGLKSVTMDATGLVGHSAGVITMTGTAIVLRNTVGALVDPGVAPQGTFAIDAGEIILGSGAKTLRGFSTVTLAAARRVTGQGTGSLDLGSAALSIATPVITAKNGANQSVTTTGRLAIARSGAAARDLDSLGSRWAFSGSQIDFGGRIDAIAGTVALTAVGGNVDIHGGALIDVGGFAKTFNDVTATTNAGTISLTSVGGSVIAHAGSTLDLSGAAAGGDAGTLSAVASGGGAVDLSGTIDAHAAAGRGGSFTLDIDSLGDFAGFSQRLEAAGFSRARQFRIRTGDVVIDGNTVVENFVLSTDAGRVTITGRIEASAAYGGNIAITGGNGLIMTAGANLLARATTELGSGRVTLDSGRGTLDVGGGVIDVSGGDGGKVRFRARQTLSGDDILVSKLAAIIAGARSATLEGVWDAPTVIGDIVVDGVLRDRANASVATFMANASAINARLQLSPDIAIAGGIAITSDGDLTLATDWNLSGLASHDGTLTLRAAGNIHVLGHLSDGFSQAARDGALLTQDSWDIRLVAGADLSASDVLAVTPIAGLPATSGSVIVGNSTNGYLVRTGTGDLTVRAGRDIKLEHYQSVIYTAGKVDTSVYADFKAPTDAVYSMLGGHLGVSAGGSISSTLPTDNTKNLLYTDWLKKAGVTNLAMLFTDQQSTWWIDHAGFTQGVGALGGGNVSVQAGGNLDNLLVALADNGRVHGGKTTVADKWLQTGNGGLMTVVAGGEVRAGNYYIARGAATIDAGSFVTGRKVTNIFTDVSGNTRSTVYDIAPVLALGDAALSVRTAGDMRLQTVLDPLMAEAPVSTALQSYMFGQTDRSELSLISTGGNITLVNQARYISRDVSANGYWYYAREAHINQYSGNIYPANTRIGALNGSISNLGQIIVLPAPRSALIIAAAQDVTAGNIMMSRATPAMLPAPFHPINDEGDIRLYPRSDSTEADFLSLMENAIASGSRQTVVRVYQQYLDSVANPDVLPNAGDRQPSRIYALKGSISRGTIVSNKQTWISAGADIRDLTLNLRNLRAMDVTWLHAGNDYIRNRSILSNEERLKPSIIIQGPGSLLLTAGRDIYSDELSIHSTGNRTFLSNNNVLSAVKGLPEYGASIEMMAGLNGRQPDYKAFASAYLDPANVGNMPDYLTVTFDGIRIPRFLIDTVRAENGVPGKVILSGLQRFVYEMTGQLVHPVDAWTVFQKLPDLTQQRFLRQVYMQELREAGRDQNRQDADGRPANGGYNRGYAAIARLFPGGGWKGNVQSDNMLIRTGFGGDIRVMTPGGGLQVAALNQTIGAGNGLVTLGYGKIDIFARHDVTVNRSRILTFSGGDLTIWSTLGGIDAGRGAKTTRVPSAPLIATDEDGVTRVTENADISGSGIGTIVGFAGVEPGDVDLIAPEGTVDAGDAGIRVSGNFNVAAMYVLNTDNIKVRGDKTGMPKAEAPPTITMLDTKDKAAADAVKDASEQQTGQRPSVIIVEVLGYGGDAGSSPDPNEDERKRRKDERQGRRQDPDSPALVVGYGQLSEAQKQLLSDKEREKL